MKECAECGKGDDMLHVAFYHATRCRGCQNTRSLQPESLKLVEKALARKLLEIDDEVLGMLHNAVHLEAARRAD